MNGILLNQVPDLGYTIDSSGNILIPNKVISSAGYELEDNSWSLTNEGLRDNNTNNFINKDWCVLGCTNPIIPSTQDYDSNFMIGSSGCTLNDTGDNSGIIGSSTCTKGFVYNGTIISCTNSNMSTGNNIVLIAGTGLKTISADNCLITGTYNSNSSYNTTSRKPLLVVGNGSSTKTSNALEIYSDGNIVTKNNKGILTGIGDTSKLKSEFSNIVEAINLLSNQDINANVVTSKGPNKIAFSSFTDTVTASLEDNKWNDTIQEYDSINDNNSYNFSFNLNQDRIVYFENYDGTEIAKGVLENSALLEKTIDGGQLNDHLSGLSSDFFGRWEITGETTLTEDNEIVVLLRKLPDNISVNELQSKVYLGVGLTWLKEGDNPYQFQPNVTGGALENYSQLDSLNYGNQLTGYVSDILSQLVVRIAELEAKLS